jgi:hypothetical protein
MKHIKTLVVAIAGLALAAVTSHASLTLNYSSTVSSTIQFNGAASTFQFNNSPVSLGGNQWQITSETGGTGSALGLLGDVFNGPFSYGAITIVSPDEQMASVIGPLGALVIHDGLGNDLTGNVDWIKVRTFDSLGGLNALLNVNVTGLAYAGLNPDLLSLVAGAPGDSMNLSFQFNPGQTLTQLTTGAGPYVTSYSGSIAAVPEPTTVVAGVLLLLPFGASTLRILRKNRTA